MSALKGMFMTCGARAPSNQLDGWGAARHHCGAGHESRINPNNTETFVKFVAAFSLCFLCGLLVT